MQFLMLLPQIPHAHDGRLWERAVNDGRPSAVRVQASASQRESDAGVVRSLLARYLAPARLTQLHRIWMVVLRAYLIGAAGLPLVKMAQLAFSPVSGG